MRRESTKKDRILDTAAELFAKEPFHKVLLSEVARLARVGKGTLYLYFESKDDLYFAVLLREFTKLIEQLQLAIADETVTAVDQMRAMVRLLVEHMFHKATTVEGAGVIMKCPATSEWREKRQQMWNIIQTIIRRGVAQGVFHDPAPERTAIYISGLIRAACLFKQEKADAASVHEHAADFILHGLLRQA